MNNKGFVFVETIVVIVVLSLGLVMVYSSFSSVVSNDKRRASYNDVAYIYRTYYIEDFLVSLNVEDYIKYYLDKEGKKIQLFNCSSPMLYKLDRNDINATNVNSYSSMPETELLKQKFCETFIHGLNVKNIYITNYNINELKHCTTRAGNASLCDKTNPANFNKYEALYSMNTNTIYYLRTLSGTDENAYRLIVEYEDKVIDNENKIPTSMNGKLVCQAGYEYDNADNICYMKKYYYANVKLVLKSNIGG